MKSHITSLDAWSLVNTSPGRMNQVNKGHKHHILQHFQQVWSLYESHSGYHGENNMCQLNKGSNRRLNRPIATNLVNTGIL